MLVNVDPPRPARRACNEAGGWERLERLETNFVDLAGHGGLLGQIRRVGVVALGNSLTEVVLGHQHSVAGALGVRHRCYHWRPVASIGTDRDPNGRHAILLRVRCAPQRTSGSVPQGRAAGPTNVDVSIVISYSCGVPPSRTRTIRRGNVRGGAPGGPCNNGKAPSYTQRSTGCRAGTSRQLDRETRTSPRDLASCHAARFCAFVRSAAASLLTVPCCWAKAAAAGPQPNFPAKSLSCDLVEALAVPA